MKLTVKLIAGAAMLVAAGASFAQAGETVKMIRIDPLTGLENSGDGDGSEMQAALFGSLAGSPRAAFSPGGAAGMADNPYAGMDISRNAPCPCGSGRKYKHCHGKAA